VAFDGNAALSFEIHVIECLILHVAFADRIGVLQQSVGEGTLAVVDVGDDAEITDIFHGDSLSVKFGRKGLVGG
jgi:hypothetical protein